MRPHLLVTVPDGPHYRTDALASAADVLGMEITRDRNTKPKAGDALVTWNLHRGQREIADAWRKAGAALIVMENGYIGQDDDGHQLYALARNGHNGSGRWLVGDFHRWESFGIAWKSELDYQRLGYTLVIGQRGIGSEEMRSPANWHHHVGAVKARERWPDSRVLIRTHPGQNVPDRSLDDDLSGAARVLIWSSACGVAALVRGIPVWYAAPFWIGRQSAEPLARLFADPLNGRPVNTCYALRDIAWSQWRLTEIASGDPLARLLMLT